MTFFAVHFYKVRLIACTSIAQNWRDVICAHSSLSVQLQYDVDETVIARLPAK